MGANEENSQIMSKSPRLPVLSVIVEDSDRENPELNLDPKSTEVPQISAKPQRKRKTSTAFAPTDSDLKQLKETATKLKLNTRRPSYLVWRAQYIESAPQSPQFVKQSAYPPSTHNEKLTNERQVKINDSLDWIRAQLTEMRRLDQNLARQFLGIRRDITRLKFGKSCEAHEDMLEDAAIGMEEFRELSKVLDEPNGSYAPSPLKHLGVTKMNLSSRRFSTC